MGDADPRIHNLRGVPVVDPDDPFQPVRTPSTPSGLPAQFADVTMDPSDGKLYAVWQVPLRRAHPVQPDRLRDVLRRRPRAGRSRSRSTGLRPDSSPTNRQAFLPDDAQFLSDGAIGGRLLRLPLQ